MAYIPNKFYCGFKSVGDDCLLGFMTPLAKDSAYDKRKSTIDAWRDTKMDATEVSNDPVTGFRFMDTERRYRTNNVLFRVFHPAIGAEFEITAENLLSLMGTCDIIKGEVQDKLLLIRDGSKNILVQENSSEHLGASSVDENGKEIFLSKDEYSIGDLISVKGKGKCVFLGTGNYTTYKLAKHGAYYAAEFSFRLEFDSVKGSLIYFPKNDEIDIVSKLQVLSRFESTTYTDTDMLNKTIYSGYDGSKLLTLTKLKGLPKIEFVKSNNKLHGCHTNQLFELNGVMQVGEYTKWNPNTISILGEASYEEGTQRILSTSSDGKFNKNSTIMHSPSSVYPIIIKVKD